LVARPVPGRSGAVYHPRTTGPAKYNEGHVILANGRIHADQ
jgi:hypothetical protein